MSIDLAGGGGGHELAHVRHAAKTKQSDIATAEKPRIEDAAEEGEEMVVTEVPEATGTGLFAEVKALLSAVLKVVPVVIALVTLAAFKVEATVYCTLMLLVSRWRPAAGTSVTLVMLTADRLTDSVTATAVLNAPCAVGPNVAAVYPESVVLTATMVRAGRAGGAVGTLQLLVPHVTAGRP